jgi:hypothetical protein
MKNYKTYLNLLLIVLSLGFSTPGYPQSLELPQVQRLSTQIMIDKIFEVTPEALKFSNHEIFDELYSYWKFDFQDAKDYLNPKGRYQNALKLLFQKMNKKSLINRIENDDLTAIKEYTDERLDDSGQKLPKELQLYNQVNSALWKASNLNSIDSETQTFIARFDSALSKLPNFKGIVFRGTAFDSDWAEKASSGQIKDLTVPAYTSTSLDIGDAFDFIRKQNKKGTMKTLMVIQSEGKLISFRGDFAREEEILIQRNAHFKIVKGFKIPVGNDEEGYQEWLILFCKN